MSLTISFFIENIFGLLLSSYLVLDTMVNTLFVFIIKCLLLYCKVHVGILLDVNFKMRLFSYQKADSLKRSLPVSFTT